MRTNVWYTMERRWIPSTGHDIALYILRPRKNARPKAQTPGVLWIHGGGYVVGMAKMIYLSRAMALVKKYGAAWRGRRPIRPRWRTATPRCAI